MSFKAKFTILITTVLTLIGVGSYTLLNDNTTKVIEVVSENTICLDYDISDMTQEYINTVPSALHSLVFKAGLNKVPIWDDQEGIICYEGVADVDKIKVKIKKDKLIKEIEDIIAAAQPTQADIDREVFRKDCVSQCKIDFPE